MKRREFLAGSAGLAGTLLPVLGRSQTKPCPPPELVIQGAGEVTTACASGQIPASGQVLLLGSPGNTALSTADSAAGFSTSYWDTSTFGAYSGGTFVPGYGSEGAYMIAGTGGHTGADVFDGVVFDFATETWSRLVNQNNMRNLSTRVLSLSETNGSPYVEALAATGQCPAPSHHYKNAVGIGANYVQVVHSFQCAGAAASSPQSHVFSTNRTSSTGTWSRFTANYTPKYPNAAEGSALMDTRGNRIWLMGQAPSDADPLPYIDLATKLWSTVDLPSPSNPDHAGDVYGHFILHDNGTSRAIISFYSGGTYGKILNLDNLSAGWATLTMQGTFPSFSGVRWAYYPVDGCHYAFPASGRGQTVWKLTPPSNIFSGAWQFSRLTPASGSFPQRTAANNHYCCFMYVPARSAFAWVAGGNTQVALWRP